MSVCFSLNFITQRRKGAEEERKKGKSVFLSSLRLCVRFFENTCMHMGESTMRDGYVC
jgi:hypothetical protein